MIDLSKIDHGLLIGMKLAGLVLGRQQKQNQRDMAGPALIDSRLQVGGKFFYWIVGFLSGRIPCALDHELAKTVVSQVAEQIFNQKIVDSAAPGQRLECNTAKDF